jgi:hypothetical protein
MAVLLRRLRRNGFVIFIRKISFKRSPLKLKPSVEFLLLKCRCATCLCYVTLMGYFLATATAVGFIQDSKIFTFISNSHVIYTFS